MNGNTRAATRWQQRQRSALLCVCVTWGAIGMSSAADARPQVSVVALFPGKAMLHIDGRPTVLQVGERSREGVLLVSADARQA
ncbi:MAG: hypothetical protein AB7K73_16685, partial [Gammaproteobacteria bacterium]